MTALDTRQLWQNALGELQIQMRLEDFRTWFRDTSLLSYDGHTCIVGVENPFNVEWLNTKCHNLVKRTLEGLVGEAVAVEFVVGHRDAALEPVPSLTLTPSSTRTAARGQRRRVSAPPDQLPVSPRYTFDSFIVGTHNRFAHAAAMAAADRPGLVHNPLFIYGGVGLGKTHLLHAIGHSCFARDLHVVYVSSESFTNEFIESISRGRMEDFRAKYRQCDVLLIDDIQFIAGKEQTQEEFFHTFNAIHQGSGQIVITSDRHPRAITTLEDRLRSRFVWGLMTDIQPPDLETRTAILRAKVVEGTRPGSTAAVPTEVLDFIAEKVPSNIRELEGALNRVLAYASMVGVPVTIESATVALREILEPGGRRPPSPLTVIDAVASVTGVARPDLEGKVRDRRIVVPRQIAMYLLRETTELSLSEIGGYFGGRDHTTVIHSCEKIAIESERDERIRGTVRAVRELLSHV